LQIVNRKTDLSRSQDVANLPLMALLGLADISNDWSRFRGMDHAKLAKLSFYRLYGTALLCLLIAMIYTPKVGMLPMGLWLAVQVAAQFYSRTLEAELADPERKGLSPEGVKRLNLAAACLAIMWLSALVFFAPYGNPQDTVATLLVFAVLIAASVFLYVTIPVSIMVFIAVLGFGSSLYLVIAEWVNAGLAMTLLTLTGLVGTVEVGRVFLKAQMAEAAATEKEAVVSMLLREFEENEADWLWEIDTARRVRSVSPRFAFAVGRSQTEVEGQPLLELMAGQSWETGRISNGLRDLAERLRAREHFANLLVQVWVMGEDRWWELSGTPMRDEGGRFIGFRGVGSDVTEQRKSSEKIAYLARYDTLTSLPNRLQVTEALGEALHYAAQWRSKCALLMVDLDRFKSVNDSLGHLTGDKLLAQVSSRLQALMGEDQLCGRLGGDEFAIVIRDATNRAMVRDLALRVIARLSEPYQVDQHTLYVGASVGSATGPQDGNSVEELMRNADLALYQAKDLGGGEHCAFEPMLHASAEERRQLEVSLRKALGRDEMVLHYQPVVDAHSQAIVSFEALVRWNSADHGFVSPGKFIPLAEDTRLIVPIGQWVMHKACEEARNWPDEVKVNVNVSPEQLLEPDFHKYVVEVLASTGLRPERLEIEVTESIFLRDASVARNALEQVMALGCSVALDDFGTGYSSLGYLRKLRFSTIKVDRTFVQGAAQGSAESLAIINAVVAMAKSLDMTTTAEGVETIEECELIRNLGCDKIQGFYFGRPMASLDAAKLFSKSARLIA
jgi:diguanylate cyclase (GGDEF)-like protein/PAS domain S-box-containing protein